MLERRIQMERVLETRPELVFRMFCLFCIFLLCSCFAFVSFVFLIYEVNLLWYGEVAHFENLVISFFLGPVNILVARAQVKTMLEK